MAFLHSRHASSTWPPLEKINVDRFTKIPDAFGDGEFWKKYSELAIKDDATTTKRLTAELDILLLFVSSVVRFMHTRPPIHPRSAGRFVLWNQHCVYRIHYSHAERRAQRRDK